MERRMFLKKAAKLGKASLMLPLLAGGSTHHASAAPIEAEKPLADLDGIGLRELAERKLHHGRDRFVNPFNPAMERGFLRLLQWKLFSENKFKQHYDEERVTPVSVDWGPVREHGGLSVTFLKHASVLIRDQGRGFLVDPIFFDILPFIKDHTPLAFDPKAIPGADHVLITHGHYDHLDARSLGTLDREAHVVTPLGYEKTLSDLRMPRHTRLDWFDTFTDEDREITLIPCDHWTMRSPIEGPDRSLWGSYILRTATGPTIYISGDTAYFDRFEEIGREFDIDLAIINLGAYEPRWFMYQSHMNPEETVRAFKALGARRLMILHWGTFRLGDEPVHFPPIDIRREMGREGLSDRLVDLKHGKTLFL